MALRTLQSWVTNRKPLCGYCEPAKSVERKVSARRVNVLEKGVPVYQHNWTGQMVIQEQAYNLVSTVQNVRISYSAS